MFEDNEIEISVLVDMRAWVTMKFPRKKWCKSSPSEKKMITDKKLRKIVMELNNKQFDVTKAEGGMILTDMHGQKEEVA